MTDQLEKQICRRDDGSIHREVYWLNGRVHREDGPAAIWYHTDGSVNIEAYYLNHQIHREDGPALIDYTQGEKHA